MSREIMQAIGVRAIEMIEENIANGIGYDGSRFAYSEQPFARPVGRLPGRRSFEKEGRLKLFTANSGALWAVVTGGYADWRAMQGLNPHGDFLQVTGKMLRNMGIIGIGADQVRIGFDDPVQAKKALWLNVLGAGSSRRLWKFLGLQPHQRTELAEYAATLFSRSDLGSLINL